MNTLKRRRHTLAEISPNKMDSPGKKARENSSPKKICAALLFDQDNLENFMEQSDLIFAEENDEATDASFIEKLVKSVAVEQRTFSLESWQRCVVEDVARAKNFDLILCLSCEKNSSEKAECRLKGVWSNTKLDVGDLVSVLGVWNQSLQCFVVTNGEGMIVTHPDHLISCTTVAGSLFCPRKTALQERFRGIDSDSKIMIVGSVTHELFQTVLSRKLRTFDEVIKASQELLQSENVMYMLYASKMSSGEIKTQLNPFVSNIVEFVERYIHGKGTMQTNDDQFTGIIETIQDIEENVWVPRLGLKGKIDVSVRVKPHHDSFNTNRKYMPLELKTGRASFSNEHKGQLILYKMMLHQIGRQVDSGLLLYLREGIMKEIHPTNNSERDIILLRNELAYYLTRKLDTNKLEKVEEIYAKYKSLMLPEPIDRYNVCTKCPYNTICCLYLKQDQSEEFDRNDTLKKVAGECLAHLQHADVEYFTHWCGLLTLEDQELKKGNSPKYLWTRKPEKRRDEGQALINLKIVGDVKVSSSKFLHCFEAVAGKESQAANFDDFMLTGMNPGDYVIVSTRKRIAIATGHIYNITKSKISINLERNLTQNYQNETFIVDKNISQTINTFNYTNLGVLLENRDESNKLRRIIVDKMQATFSEEKFSVPKETKDILMELNADQRRAVVKALKMNDYMLVKGLPGTGKTQTLVAIIRLLNLMRKSIIITSHTHSAVDNVLQRLRSYNIKFLRLGSDSRINSSLHDCGENKVMSGCRSSEELAQRYASYNIIGVTCHGAAHSIFLHRRFDVCIVDEATQVFQPTVLRPLFYADKFILVGDPDQLPPVVKSKLARTIGASQSLFHRLDDPHSTAILLTQYRMNKTVTKLANGLTYSGKLVCANEIVMNRTIELPFKASMFDAFKKDKWLLRTLEMHLDLSVIMLDTKDCLQRSIDFEQSQSNRLSAIIKRTFSEETEIPRKSKLTYTNYCDAAIAFSLVKGLVVGGCPANNIGIIAPYRAQVELLRKIYENHLKFYSSSNIAGNDCISFEGLEVNTVDQYQGRDKDIIIYSCTRTGCTTLSTGNGVGRGVELLEDQHRLTVAITRSKCKLIIIGDAECLQMYTPYRDLLEKIPARCKIVLDDGRLGFSWQDVFNDLKKVFVI